MDGAAKELETVRGTQSEAIRVSERSFFFIGCFPFHDSL
jgi:hypothetical protein